MKEHPILFSTPMVKALLEGRKTQTRRIIKPQGRAVCFDVAMHKDGSDKWPRNLDADERYISDMNCPYGKVGDILWVRETWGLDYFGYARPWHFKEGIKVEQRDIIYRADDEDRDKRFLLDESWKPSIFMPRAACRIRLEIIDIKVERVQNITDEDSLAEGVLMNQNIFSTGELKEAYKQLWCKINGSESWNKNPWVWVIEFKQI